MLHRDHFLSLGRFMDKIPRPCLFFFGAVRVTNSTIETFNMQTRSAIDMNVLHSFLPALKLLALVVDGMQ